MTILKVDNSLKKGKCDYMFKEVNILVVIKS